MSYIDHLRYALFKNGKVYAFALPVALIAGYTFLRWFRQRILHAELQGRIDKRLIERDAQFARAREITDTLNAELERKILAWDIDELLEALKSGDVTCIDVLYAYIRQALDAHDKTNCLTSIVMESISMAKKLDTLAADANYKKPPLFGFPLSIKSNISIKGQDINRGYAQEICKPMERDSLIVKQLIELGAVPFCCTNVPQSLLTFSCQNPIFGTTTHPMSRDRTPGGSSGGEGALIASGGSLIGIGNDVGGSIRIPSAFCGIAGIKPTQGRLSSAGEVGSVPGRSHVFGSNGPMARTVSGCVHILRAVWADKHWVHSHDAYTAPTAWNEEAFMSTRKLRIGYYTDDGAVEAVPSMRRAVEETRACLEAAGHTLVRIEPPAVWDAYLMFMNAVLLDNGRFILDMLDEDIMQPTYAMQMRTLRMPFFMREIIAFLMQPFSRRTSEQLRNYQWSITDLRRNYEKIEQYWITWKDLFKEQELDCLICPSFATPAPRHTDPYLLQFNVIYTALFNLLNYPAGSVPVTRVTQDDLNALKDYHHVDMFSQQMIELAKGTLNFPVGVQVAALPFHDETVLRVMAEIEKASPFEAAN